MRRLLIGGLVLATVACGKSSEQQQAEEAAKKVEQGAQAMQEGAAEMAKGAQDATAQMAQGLQQMAQGFQQMAQGTAKPVEFESLKALLPQIAGWEQRNARGEEVTVPMAISRAEAQYYKGDSHIEIEIVDSAMSQLLLAPMNMFLASGYAERSDDGFKRAAKVGGSPGFEEWQTASKRGEVTAVIGNRFIVKGTGNDVDSIDVVRQSVESVDLKKLAALK